MIFLQIFLSNLGFNGINIIKDNLFLEVNSPFKGYEYYCTIFCTIPYTLFIRIYWKSLASFTNLNLTLILNFLSIIYQNFVLKHRS